VVDKDTLPLKVWSDCVRCPKRDGCDEIAMVRVLEDVPEIQAEKAAATPRGVSIPVLPFVADMSGKSHFALDGIMSNSA
jgi:amino-acid N-acetyltransferase